MAQQKDNKKVALKKLGKRLKHLMDLSIDQQQTIAKRAKVQPTEISRWQRGEVAPSYMALINIARALKLKDAEIGWLFDGRGSEPKPPSFVNMNHEDEGSRVEDASPESSIIVDDGATSKDEDVMEKGLLHKMIDSQNETISLLKEKVSNLEHELKKDGGKRKKANGI